MRNVNHGGFLKISSKISNRLSGASFIALLLTLSLVWAGRSLAQEDDEVQAFFGTSPAISDSTATLTFGVDPTTKRTFRWESSDSVLGAISTGDITGVTWVVTGTDPTRLVFTGSGDGATFYGNVLFEPYNRAVIDVVKGGKRVRYSLTKVVPEIVWVNDKFEEAEFVPIPPMEVNAPFAHTPGEPGGQGGFGGPPAGSNLVALSDPFRIENLQLNDQGNVLAGTMTLTVKSNVSAWEQDYTLTETEEDSNVYVDAEDSLAIQILEPSAEQAGEIDQMQFFIASIAFGSRRSMVVYETGPNTRVYASEHLELVVTMAALPDPGSVDSIHATLSSNLKSDVEGDVLTETENDSLVFENATKTFRVAFEQISSSGPAAKDDFIARVTSQALQVGETEVDAIETSVDTLEFRTDALHNAGEAGTGASATRGLAIEEKWQPILEVIKYDLTERIDDIEARIQRKRGDAAPVSAPTLKWVKSNRTIIKKINGFEVEHFVYELKLPTAEEKVFFLLEEEGTVPVPVFNLKSGICKVLVKPSDTLVAIFPGRKEKAELTIFKIDLNIYNGQGGAEVVEKDEENIGAFTVANLNDTDGDGTVDKNDNDVTGEKDLMQLVIKKPDPDLDGEVILTVPSGVKLWKSSTKSAGEETNRNFQTNKLPLTFYVELTEKSETVRDKKIVLEYKGAKDKVRATGVWAEQLSFRNADGEGLSADADGTGIQGQLNHNGGSLGMKMVPATGIVPVSFYNNVEIGFTVYPEGIGSESQVAFDISRQRNTQGVKIVNGVHTGSPADPFPTQDELPNDDADSAGGNDEDVIPKNNHIFVIDGPGVDVPGPVAVTTSVRYFRERHFKEFVRVRFEGTRPHGNTIEGSRCSDKVLWFANDDVLKAGGAAAFSVTSSSSGLGNPAFNPLP